MNYFCFKKGDYMKIYCNKHNLIKKLIYSEGRLLERKLFQYYFEDGTKEACIKAFIAYQNDDKGFGNGIEPDLLTPSSSGIGAETALFVIDILDYKDDKILEDISDWLKFNVNADGILPYPPANIKEYPYQPWWGNPDKERILSVTEYFTGMSSVRNEVPYHPYSRLDPLLHK